MAETGVDGDHGGGSVDDRRPHRVLDRLPDRAWVPAVAAALLALVFAGALLVRAGGDPSLLVHAAAPCTTEAALAPTTGCAASPAGEDQTDGRAGAPGSLTVQPAAEAFDGQFFYRLGVSPWSRDERVAGVQYDLPALRNARWGYGALAFLASGGDPDLVPWSLLGLNLIAAAAVGAVGGALARSSGRHAAWGLLFALWPGFAYSLSLDTSELVASAFALAAILALRRRRWGAAGLALAAAIVTRDTTAALAGGLAVGAAGIWWTERRVLAPAAAPAPARPGAPSAAVPVASVALTGLAVFAVWQLVQRARFGVLPLTSSGDNNLSTPLAGLADGLRDVVPPNGGDEVFRLAAMAALVGLIGLAAWCWRSSTTPLAERVAWFPAVAVVALLNAYLWSGATAFLRAGTEAGLLSILVLLGSRRDRLLALAGAGLLGMWLLTAAGQLSKLG